MVTSSGPRPRLRLWIVALVLTVPALAVWVDPSGAQTPGASTSTTVAASTSRTIPPTSTTVVNGGSTSERLTELEKRTADLTVERASDRSALDSLQSFLMWAFAPIAILVGILAAGGILGMINAVHTENRSEQLHQLTLGGEATGQLRAEQSHVTFLEASQKTLTLVNETLELAKDASARAATSMAERATRKLDELTRRARAELAPYTTSGDFKGLVTTARTTKAATEIANELLTLEGLFSVQDITITAPCLFMRGLERHLMQASDEAIAALRESVGQPDGEIYADLAYYWIAYENNDLGDYLQAESTFRRAKERAAQQGRVEIAIELEIQELEARFFSVAQEFAIARRSTASAEELRAALEHGIDRLIRVDTRLVALADEARDHRAGVANLQGNLAFWQAQQWRSLADSAKERFLWDTAERAYEGAGSGWYAVLARLETAWRLHELDKTKPAPARKAYQELIPTLLKQIEGRKEARSRALLREAQLLARGRAALLDDDERARTAATAEIRSLGDAVRNAVDDVRTEITLYSLLTKSNTDRAAFLAESAALTDELCDAITEAAT